jgi:hypothetical protein
MSDEIYGYLAVLGAIFFFGSIGAAVHQSFIEIESFHFSNFLPNDCDHTSSPTQA